MNTKMLYKKLYNPHSEIIYSIIIPIYNQENTVADNLKSVIDNTEGNYEIIIILDYCFDNTEKNLMEFINSYKNVLCNFIQITILKNENLPLFETKCDNIGFKLAEGKFCLEIQADMKMTELGYNIHLSKPFNILENVIAVSGRCAHNLFNHRQGIGKLGSAIEKTVNELNISKNKFYVYETCNRGPLLIDRAKLKELNYLNEEVYFLEDSDHDLFARAYIEKKYICGYVPIDFYAPLYLGSIRNINTYNNCIEYNINKNERQRLLDIYNKHPGLDKYRLIWEYKPSEIYDI